MSTTDQGKTTGKSGRRTKGEPKNEPKNKAEKKAGPKSEAKAKRAAPVKSAEPARLQTPDLPPPSPPESAIVNPPPVAEPAEIAASAPVPSAPEQPVSVEPVTPVPAEATPVSLQTIATAYRDYTRKSFEEFGSFVEQLTGARSLEKAMTVHSDFIKRAYETSIAESKKIAELHSRLARQSLDPFKGLAGKTQQLPGKR